MRIGLEFTKRNYHKIEDDVRSSLEKQLKLLTEGANYLRNSNRYYQEGLYNQTHSTDYARTTIRIPLDKKINSYYDDFHFRSSFYDDVCTFKWKVKFEEYKALKTEKDRRKFIKNNTEITHMGLLYLREERLISIIALMGELNTTDPRN